VAFKYEKLPKFCYTCGIIKHGRQGCAKPGIRAKAGDEEEQQYGPWLRVPFPPRRVTSGELQYGRNRIEGEPGGSQDNRDTETGSANTILTIRSPATGGWTGVSSPRNPNSMRKVSISEGKQGSRDEVNAGDTSMIYGRELRELEEEIMGKANEALYGKNVLPNVETGDINKDEGSSGPKKENKTRYVGCWDSSLGRMRYENIDESSCDILLERDPRDNTYHPCVVPRTQEDGQAVFHSKAVKPSHTEKSKEVDIWTPKVQENLEGTESTPNPLTAKGKIRKSPGLVANWKKRARQGLSSVVVTVKKKGEDGKRKQVEEVGDALDGADSQPKKGRKADTLHSGLIYEPVVSVEQPRPAQ